MPAWRGSSPELPAEPAHPGSTLGRASPGWYLVPGWLPVAGGCSGLCQIWSFSISTSHRDGLCARAGSRGAGGQRGWGSPEAMASPQPHAQAAGMGMGGGFKAGGLCPAVAVVAWIARGFSQRPPL